MFVKKLEKTMTHIHLRIPDDLRENLNQIADKDIESFVIEAIRHELDRNPIATDSDIEKSSVLDLSSDFLSPVELRYYLDLPNHV